ncbi:putative secreted protein (Por secretion system target) [Chryseobacterium sp. CBTAP 102]|uniref:trypsin-like serine peptidase n=1 Tax=Chryseobacterium sp. CBTAP 102 TaxID=2135644 RepID=UPI000D763250|nr:T9SS type A sorting domain-containing protein [Chryseobacterium sp. CBTAP 102]PXW10789.1 putative secreted protein (Por secretion system target) [Chryseobacterium sp. CBTAP 102]
MMKYLIIFFLFCLNFVKSQVGDNGYPFLYEKLVSERRITTREEYKNSLGEIIPLLQLKQNIKTFETKGFSNQGIIDEVSNLTDEAYANQNIYGKTFYKEINITDDSNRIEYDGRYYYLYKVTSSDAKALQIYFKKYLLPENSKLFLYAENGFILGEFNNKNNPDTSNKGLEFGTQPIPGNTFYIELSYSVDSSEKPLLTTEKVIHSFTDFYSGVYGAAGNCHKNVACVFSPSENRSRNIKSVGLMLYPIYQSGTNTHTYSATCSGNLMNNTAQNGEPYFLTAAHCIGYEAANNNINWSTELITLFNYEALSCTSNGADAPSSLSNTSVFGCTLLTQSPYTSFDYALIKLKITPSLLAQYKVCYAGWDNNPNAYSVNPTNAYSVHHPKGDVKKISMVQELYPVMGSNPILFNGYSVPHLQSTDGTFLQNSWRNGIVEKGSSGSPLFNSFDRLIGSLSTGPDPNIFNCNNPNIYNATGPTYYTYYSRFSNNYYTMSPWLNPNGTNVQSIGPYCPTGYNIQIGAPIDGNTPGGGNPQPTNWQEEPIDVNGEKVHPANTWGKKIYLKEFNGSGNYQQQVDENFNYYRSVMAPNKNTFAMSENIYDIYEFNINNFLPNLQLWGIYKVIDCNKIKYIKPAKITIKNPGSNGQVFSFVVDVVGVSDNRVHILIEEWRRNTSGAIYKTFEIQSYKIINNELIYENYKTLFYNQQNLTIFKYYDFDNGRLMLSVRENSNLVNKIYSCFYNEQNGSWLMETTPIANGTSGVFTKIIGNKVFIQPSGQNKIDIYNFVSNSPAFNLRASLSNQFLSAPATNYLYDPLFIFERSNDLYNIVYRNGNGVGSFELMQLDLSNNSASSSHITTSDDFKTIYFGYGSHFIMKNNQIIKLSKFPWKPSPGGEYPNYSYMNFKKNSNGNWIKDKATLLKWSEVGGFNDQYIISDDYKEGNDIKRRMFSIREVDYLAHPYTTYNDEVFYSSAYHRPKKLDNPYFSSGVVVNGREEFRNLAGTNLNIFLFRSPNLGYDFNTTTYDTKTVILDNKTQQLTGYKSVTIHGKYSVVMKPGFSVSATSGIEFTAKAQAPLPADIPACSLTFDDMLNPKTTETPNETLYLKQTIGKFGNKPYYGEIVLNDGNLNQESIIDRAVKLYPNPTKDILNIDFNGKKFKTLEVYSIDAKKIITKEVSSLNTTEVNLSQYPAGIYMVTLIDSTGKSYPNKIIKK